MFFPSEIDKSVHNLMKEKLQDKLENLLKYDQNAFNEIFNFGFPKLNSPIENKEHLLTMNFDINVAEINLKKRDLVFEEFKKIEKLNNIVNLLKLYTSVPLSKAAKVSLSFNFKFLNPLSSSNYLKLN